MNKQLFTEKVHITLKHEKHGVAIKDMQMKTTMKKCAFAYQISKDLKTAMWNDGKALSWTSLRRTN